MNDLLSHVPNYKIFKAVIIAERQSTVKAYQFVYMPGYPLGILVYIQSNDFFIQM